jgi:hypothetical protein
MSRQELGEESPNILPRLFIGHSGSIEKETLSPEKREHKIKTMVVKDMMELDEPQTLKKEVKQKMSKLSLFSKKIQKKMLQQLV